MNPLLIYLIIINASGFLLMLTDKYRAQNNLWRIPEATLMGCAIIGGSLGCLIGMYAARHKTKKNKFRFCFILLSAIHFVIIFCFIL